MSEFPFKKMSLNEAREYLRELDLGPPILDLDAEPTCMSDYVSPEDQIIWRTKENSAVYGLKKGLRWMGKPGKCRVRFISPEALLEFVPGATPTRTTLHESLNMARSNGNIGVVLYDEQGEIVGEWPC